MAGKTIASKTGQVRYNVPGATGPIGPLVYPAGEYDAATKYIRTSLSAPMVLDDGQYYVLNKEGAFTGIRPKDDYAANGSNATWVLMEYVKYAFLEILMANFAKLASAVFYEQYMFSQQGVGADGNPTSDYRNFTGEDGTAFQPNILMNFLTGYASFKKIKIEGDIIAKSIGLQRVGSGASISNGCYVGEGVFVAPELDNGEVRVVYYGVPLMTKVLMEITINSASDKVLIKWGNELQTTSSKTFSVGNTFGIILGVGRENDTLWNIYELFN